MSDPLAAIQAGFEAAWPGAQAAFSPYTRLLPPIYCRTEDDEKREGLTGSFAMIRMKDDRIVISIRQIAALGLGDHARAILAHEVGHYVHAPGTLREHVRLHDRIRRTLPVEHAPHAGLVANLYTDLLLNDRLQRSAGVDIAGVYVALRKDDAGPLWTLYTRIYERLWALTTGTLGPRPTAAIDGDADLGARIVRLFRDRWMDGAPSFALLVAPYLDGLPPDRAIVPPWLDTAGTSVGEGIPDGLLEDDFDPAGVSHPAVDARLSDRGDDDDDEDEDEEGAKPEASGPDASGRSMRGDGRPDRRSVKRTPQQWLELLRAVGVQRSPQELVARYYRELAMPHVIPFPAELLQRAGDPLPEGLGTWEPGSPLEKIDWFASLAHSPFVIPGVTTLERLEGVQEGGEPEKRPPDLYVGIDCSGSMGNPAFQVAYPVVAGVVLTLSALRAGARVMACLSGEWHGDGKFVQTDGFARDEGKLLGVLTDYLGTGASFGLPRLVQTFAIVPPQARRTHVLIVSDTDLFGEIDGTKDGWALARRAVEHAGGGGTAVLRLAETTRFEPWLAKLREAGFEPYCVSSAEELVTFARAFARRTFGWGKEARA